MNVEQLRKLTKEVQEKNSSSSLTVNILLSQNTLHDHFSILCVDMLYSVTISPEHIHSPTEFTISSRHKHMPRARFQPQRRCAAIDTTTVPVQTGC